VDQAMIKASRRAVITEMDALVDAQATEKDAESSQGILASVTLSPVALGGVTLGRGGKAFVDG